MCSAPWNSPSPLVRSGCRRSCRSIGRSPSAAAAASAWPRPRASARSSRCRRSRRGPCGSVVASVALPSLVTSTTEPVSATKKLPPEIPMSAVRIVLAQHAARLEAQLLDPVLRRRAMLAREQLGDLLLRLVQRRADDVRRRLVVVDLQDVFAEVGLDDRHARRFDRVVERDLLGDHRLRLDDLAHGVPLRDLEHQRVDVGGRLRPTARSRRAPSRCASNSVEPEIEVVERALRGSTRRVARALEVVELGDRRRARCRRTCPASSSGSSAAARRSASRARAP